MASLVARRCADRSLTFTVETERVQLARTKRRTMTRASSGPPWQPVRCAALVFVLLLLAGGWPVSGTGEPGRIEDFEGAETSWTIAGGDCRAQVEIHRRTARYARHGNRCEHIRIRAQAGTYVYATHPIQPAMVIRELRPTVWVRSDRVGLQMLARVVLPRTSDPQTGRPLTTMIRGSAYEHVGTWQRLQIQDPQALLERRVPALRAQFGPQVDPREAFVDLLVLNVYGGLGTTNTWIDDLQAENQIAPAEPLPERQAAASAREPATGSRAPTEAADRRVQFQRSILLVDGHPFFPRAIQYQGEPLGWLAQLGFNAVRLPSPPTPAQCDEARQLGLWLIAPPADIHPAAVDAEHQVLAWDLGSGLNTQDLPALQSRIAQVRGYSIQSRPLVCSADADLYAFSRHADVLLHERNPLGTSLDLEGYQRWLAQRRQLARPGTPFWVTIQSEPNQQVQRQLDARQGGDRAELYAEPESVRTLTLLAVTAGAQGVSFQSHSPLNGQTPQARLRALVLPAHQSGTSPARTVDCGRGKADACQCGPAHGVGHSAGDRTIAPDRTHPPGRRLAAIARRRGRRDRPADGAGRTRIHAGL